MLCNIYQYVRNHLFRLEDGKKMCKMGDFRPTNNSKSPSLTDDKDGEEKLERNRSFTLKNQEI